MTTPSSMPDHAGEWAFSRTNCRSGGLTALTGAFLSMVLTMSFSWLRNDLVVTWVSLLIGAGFFALYGFIFGCGFNNMTRNMAMPGSKMRVLITTVSACLCMIGMGAFIRLMSAGPVPAESFILITGAETGALMGWYLVSPLVSIWIAQLKSLLATPPLSGTPDSQA